MIAAAALPYREHAGASPSHGLLVSLPSFDSFGSSAGSFGASAVFCMLPRVVAKDTSEASAEAAAAALADERDLVVRAQAGDRPALGQLLERYGPTLYRAVLLPRLGSDAAARDALSDTYAKVVERIGQFVWQNVGFYPWLRVVAMRVALDQLRARRKLVLWDAADVEREVDETSSSTPLDDKLSEHRDRRAAQQKVEDALSRIHPRYAEAIRLRVLEERPRDDVAKTLGVTPATFDVLLHRATAALKKAITQGPTEKSNA